VQPGLVVFRERHGHAALRVLGVRLARALLRQSDDARARTRHLQRRAQARHARPDDDEIGLAIH
jgi:hypothetical protein